MGGRIDLCHNQPWDPVANGGGGYYQMAIQSGAVAGAISANSDLFCLYWNPVAAKAAGRTCRFELKYFKVNILVPVGYTSGQIMDFNSLVAKTMTASDTGGTQKIPASGDQKRQQRYPDSQFVSGGDIRMINTGALTNGTRTLEAIPFDTLSTLLGTTATMLTVPLYENLDEHHVPLVLEPGQGFVLQNNTAFGAGGTSVFYFDMGWMESYEPAGW